MLKLVSMQTKSKTMEIRPTFFNTRIDRLHHNYTDTNNLLFIIFFKSGAELSFILRDLKKNENVVNYIYKRLHRRFNNIIEIESSIISYSEYNLMKQQKIPSVIKIC